VREYFDYLPETGRLVRIKNKTSGRIGKIVGRIEGNKGCQYRRVPFLNSSWPASWMVWAWHHGSFPNEMLARRNGDSLDDSIENLALWTELRRPVKVAHDLPSEDQPDTMLGDLPEAFNTGIYEIRNTKNGRRYIGSAVNVSKRWRDHIRQLEDGRHHSRFMQRCWNKNGSDCFIFRVLLACEKNDLLMYEQRAIDTIQPQYNSAPKAGSQLGLKMSDEAKAKMAAAARRTKNFTGCTHSEETKRRISEKKRGVKQNPDVVAKRASSIRALKGRHSAKKFTESQIIEIRARSDAGEKNIVIAREYGVSDSVICEIKNRKAYRWVD
jgi:group I intron endonuclease